MTGWHLRKIMSGGQTGVDRAALDVALSRGIPCGGWCPKGRLAEDGVIPARYPLVETGSADVEERTRLNVRDSDVTLVIVRGVSDAGTDYTLAMTTELGRPSLRIDLDRKLDPAAVVGWLASFETGLIVNIAGPRESNAPGIHAMTREYLRWLLRDVPLDDDLHKLTDL